MPFAQCAPPLETPSFTYTAPQGPPCYVRLCAEGRPRCPLRVSSWPLRQMEKHRASRREVPRGLDEMCCAVMHIDIKRVLKQTWDILSFCDMIRVDDACPGDERQYEYKYTLLALTLRRTLVTFQRSEQGRAGLLDHSFQPRTTTTISRFQPPGFPSWQGICICICEASYRAPHSTNGQAPETGAQPVRVGLGLVKRLLTESRLSCHTLFWLRAVNER